MSPDPTLAAILLVAWSIVGTSLGAVMAMSGPHDPSPWTRANWAQRIVLAVIFGPLFAALCVANVLAKRFVYPPVARGWNWLGKL